MRSITQDEFKNQMGLEVGDDGVVTLSSIATLVCTAVQRWRFAPKRQVSGYVKEQLRSANLLGNVAEDRFRFTLDMLIAVGAIESLQISGRAFFANVPVRWIQISPTHAVLTGTVTENERAILSSKNDDSGTLLAPYFNPEDIDLIARLQINGVVEWTLSDWRGENKYVEHLLRRDPRTKDLSLIRYWHVLQDDLNNHGLPMAEDTEVRVVGEKPGTFFGNGKKLSVEGRWTTSPKDGVWCGLRKGYNENHWHPVLVNVTGENRRFIDLYDFDEWDWALLARGRAVGNEEAIERKDELVTFTFPIPYDIKRLMLLLGISLAHKSWSWKVPTNCPDYWSDY